MTEPAATQVTAPRGTPASATPRSGQALLRTRHDLIVCNECDAVYQRLTPQRGTVLRCQRCNALLGRGHRLRPDALLAFAAGALLLLLIGNLEPIATLEQGGVVSQATLLQAIEATWHAGAPLVALLTAATAMVFPLGFTLLRLYLLASLVRGRTPAGFVPTMHLLRFVTRWSMVEVFMMGTLVAVVRSASLTSTTPGFGLLAYGALTLLLTSITASGTHGLWRLAGHTEAAR